MQFTAQDYAETRTSEITEHTGTSKANDYAHFASKE